MIPYDSALPLPPLHRFSFAQAAVECRLTHAVLPENFVKRHFFFLPLCYNLVKVRRCFFCRSSESHTALFCCRDSLRLPLTNRCTLVFRDERQQLQDKVADECSEQFLSRRVSRSGISITTISTFFSFVMILHWF